MKTGFSKKIYFSTDNSDYAEDFINYLDKLGGKEFKSQYLRENLFKTAWNSKENPIRDRCQIQSAKKYFEFLIKKENSRKQIENLVADLIPYIYALDKNENLDFIVANSNIIHSTIHFHSAKNLFYQHQILDSHQDNYMSDLLAVYALRLSLEKRIRAILGIDFATSNGRKVGMSTFIEVAQELKSIEYSENINWNHIKLVINWANHFMHRHIRPYPWVIHEAIQVLETLLNSKKPINLKNGRKLYSHNSPIYVENKSEFEKEIDEIIKSKIPNIKISKLDYKEVIIDE